jgi:hypothetical protein
VSLQQENGRLSAPFVTQIAQDVSTTPAGDTPHSSTKLASLPHHASSMSRGVAFPATARGCALAEVRPLQPEMMHGELLPVGHHELESIVADLSASPFYGSLPRELSHPTDVPDCGPSGPSMRIGSPESAKGFPTSSFSTPSRRTSPSLSMTSSSYSDCDEEYSSPAVFPRAEDPFASQAVMATPLTEDRKTLLAFASLETGCRVAMELPDVTIDDADVRLISVGLAKKLQVEERGSSRIYAFPLSSNASVSQVSPSLLRRAVSTLLARPALVRHTVSFSVSDAINPVLFHFSSPSDRDSFVEVVSCLISAMSRGPLLVGGPASAQLPLVDTELTRSGFIDLTDQWSSRSAESSARGDLHSPAPLGHQISIASRAAFSSPHDEPNAPFPNLRLCALETESCD